ncbi:MAG: caspase family protein [Myxococcales bacterium]|nr:caspase family protein [Myxococcales bacterium]
MSAFAQSHALVVGINAYANLPQLDTARADAEAVTEVLRAQQYQVTTLVDHEASKAALDGHFAGLAERVGPDDRLLIYFAGHGIARDGDADGRPKGFLVPHDANREDDASLLEMDALNEALHRIQCRHRLLLLDCCFAGSFRWASYRTMRPERRQGALYRDLYRRYVNRPAAQVLTSAAADQEALDEIRGMALGQRSSTAGHSPFASFLLDALTGKADVSGSSEGAKDGIITATELHLYVSARMAAATGDRGQPQTPLLWQLPEHGAGEYVFWPGAEPDPDSLPEDPRLDAAANPWRGVEAYDATRALSFFGREAELTALEAQLDQAEPRLIAVTGPSGSGRSSLIRAGLMPRLRRDPRWAVIDPISPGTDAIAALRQALAACPPTHEANAPRPVVVIDPLDEVFAATVSPTDRDAFFGELRAYLDQDPAHRLVVTLREDLAAPAEASAIGARLRQGRHDLPPMDREALREVLIEPARRLALHFDPPELVDQIVDDVVRQPGALPMLSTTLAEMYHHAGTERGWADRALTPADLEAVGGVAGPLRRLAEALYHDPPMPEADATPAEGAQLQAMQDMQVKATEEGEKVSTRMAIAWLTRRLTRREGTVYLARQALLDELRFDAPSRQARIERIIERFVAARVLIRGAMPSDRPDAPLAAGVRPAHDEVIRGLLAVQGWDDEPHDEAELQADLWNSALRWKQHDKPGGLLWNSDPRLDRVIGLRGRLNAIEGAFVDASSKRRARLRMVRLGGLLLAILVLGGLSIYAISEAERADDMAEEANQQARKAEKRRQEAYDQRRRAESLAQRATDAQRVAVAEQMRHTDPTTSALILSDPDQPLDDAPLELLIDLESRLPLATVVLTGHDGGLTAAAFSPDGQHIVTASEDGTARIWQADGEGDAIVLRGHGGAVLDASFSPDGQRVLTASADGTARVWQLGERARPRIVARIVTPDETPVRSAAFDPDGARIVTGAADGAVRIWRADAGGLLRTLPGHAAPVNAVAFSASGKQVASAAEDGMVQVSNSDGTGPPRRFRHPAAATSVAFSPDDNRMVVGTRDNKLRLRPLRSMARETVFAGHTDPVLDAAFSVDGRWIISASVDGTARIWPTDNAHPPLVLAGHQNRVRAAAFSPDGRRAATASDDGTARVWQLDDLAALRLQAEPPTATAFCADGSKSGTAYEDGFVYVTLADEHPAVRLGPHPARISALAFDPTGQRLASATEDGRVHLWATDRLEAATVFEGPTHAIDRLAFSPDGTRLAAIAPQEGISVWRLDGTGSPVRLPGACDADFLNFSPDGTQLLAACADAVWLWGVGGTRPPIELSGHKRPIRSAEFSPDGQRVATASDEGTVRLWASDGTLLRTLDLGGGQVMRATFDATGQRLLTASWEDRAARLFDVATREPLRVLEGHHRGLYWAAFDAGGARVVTASDDRTVRLWPLDTKDEPTIIRGHQSAVMWAGFSTDGQRLMTRSQDGKARIWPLDRRPLQRSLDARIRWCLPADFIERRLGASADEAQAERARCLARKGQPREPEVR